MTKQKINNLLDNLNTASDEDLEMLLALSKRYPYSQPIAILQAKIANKLNNANHKKYLSKAAIYAVDRNNLKAFIQEGKPLPNKKELEKRKVEEPITQNTSDRPVIPDPEKAPEPSAETPHTTNEEETESSQLFKEVMENLDELKALRKKYEFLEKQEEENKTKKNSDKSPIAPSTESQSPDTTEHDPNENGDQNTPSIKSDSDTSTEQSAPEPENKNIENMPVSDQVDSDQAENPNKLIENYLENEPNYAQRRAIPEEEDEKTKQDLSMNSATISEDLVSENLAILMINQGKTDKAIDIYKKLIWKFPQKKAYFASRIEELTNQK